MMSKRLNFVTLAALAGLMGPAPTLAHHGWQWAESQNSELKGKIKSVKLGNPHGVLVIEVEGAEWTVEVGQPWRNARAGLKDEMLQTGVEVTIEGHKSANAGERRMKAERVTLDGQRYDLYPDRD